MTDDEWEEQRRRAVLAAFQTGRPVFANTDGELRYADEGREPLADEDGVPRGPVPAAKVRTSWWARIRRWIGGRP